MPFAGLSARERELGYRDAMLRKEELQLFLGGQQLEETIMVPQLQGHSY